MTSATILVYHRIGEPTADPWALTVTPDHFAAHLAVLRREFLVMPVRDLARALHDAPSAARLVCVTLDDGYRETVTAAVSMLRSVGVPATVFLPTGFLGSEREFWWDELTRVLLEAHPLPPVLRLHLSGRIHEWDLTGAAHGAPPGTRRWRAWEDPPGPRQRAYRDLYPLLQPMVHADRERVLDDMLAWAGLEPEGRSAYRSLTPDDVRTLRRESLIEVGAHSVTHSVLSRLPEEAQRVEVQESKTALERLLGRPVVGFAYPYGRREDYSAQTAALVREAGCAYACTNTPGPVERDTDPFQLPRLFVEDWDGEEFRRRLPP